MCIYVYIYIYTMSYDSLCIDILFIYPGRGADIPPGPLCASLIYIYIYIHIYTHIYIYTHHPRTHTPNSGQKQHETIAGATPTQHPQRPHSIQNYRKHIVKQMKTAQTGNPSLNPPPGRSMSMGVVPSS